MADDNDAHADARPQRRRGWGASGGERAGDGEAGTGGPPDGPEAPHEAGRRRGFNPAWLLVPAAGLLLGGLGVANMNTEQRPASMAPSTVEATKPVPPGALPYAQQAIPGGEVEVPEVECRAAFTNTVVEEPVARIKDSRSGDWYRADEGKSFVVVTTTFSNQGVGDCWARPGRQRGYTGSGTYYKADEAAGARLAPGRLMAQVIDAGTSVRGAYVFEIPSGQDLTSVHLRSDDDTNWTVIRVR